MLKSKLQDERAVITLEAGIVLPIFIMLLLFFYGIIIMFLGEQVITHALSQATQSLSLDAFATDLIDEDEEANFGGAIQSIYEAIYTNPFNATNDVFYSNEKWYEGDESELISAIETRFSGYLAGGREVPASFTDDLLRYVGVENGINGFSFKGSTVTDDVLTVSVSYHQNFLFDFHGLVGFDRQYTVTAKMWRQE